MLNINLGYNKVLMKQCKTLKEYMLYVEKVRNYAKEMELPQAVEKAVEESITEGILAEFLTRSKAEVVQMSIFEYDEEKELEKIRKAEREAGVEEGRAYGKAEGVEEGIALSQIVAIRRSLDKGMELTVIADIVGEEKAYVKQVIELITENPEDTDKQIVESILK